MVVDESRKVNYNLALFNRHTTNINILILDIVLEVPYQGHLSVHVVSIPYVFKSPRLYAP